MAEQISNKELEKVTKVVIMGEEFNIYGNEENPLFLAADVAEMIEYSVDKVHQMVDLVDDDEKLTDTIYRSGQKREMWFLTENGLYEVLMQSRKPLAKRFKTSIKKMLHKIRTSGMRKTRLNDNLLIIENATIMFRNFTGVERTYNRAGDRNFCVIIDDTDVLQQLISDGWNVKILKPRDVEDEPKHYIPVSVRFDNFPPNIYIITKNNKIRMDEESVNSLDYAEIANADVIINASKWEANGKTGIKAYLKTMYITLTEDVFVDKYGAVETLPFN